MPPHKYPSFDAVRHELSRGQCDALTQWAHTHSATMAEVPGRWESERLTRLRRRKTETLERMDRLNEERDGLHRELDELNAAIRKEEARQ